MRHAVGSTDKLTDPFRSSSAGHALQPVCVSVEHGPQPATPCMVCVRACAAFGEVGLVLVTVSDDMYLVTVAYYFSSRRERARCSRAPVLA